jgi:YggT family protein
MPTPAVAGTGLPRAQAEHDRPARMQRKSIGCAAFCEWGDIGAAPACCQQAAGTVSAWRLVRHRRSSYMCALSFSCPDGPMRALIDVIRIALQLYIYLIIAAAVLSWLIAFGVVNTRNQFVAMVGDFLYRITEPALRPIRNFMPNLGGIDISPIILILLIILIDNILVYYIRPYVF